MAGSAAFTWVCDELQRATALSELEARGTVRLALKQAGLDAKSASRDEMSVLLKKILPAELVQRSVENAGTLCAELATRLASQRFENGDAPKDIEAVFRRLGGAD